MTTNSELSSWQVADLRLREGTEVATAPRPDKTASLVGKKGRLKFRNDETLAGAALSFPTPGVGEVE